MTVSRVPNVEGGIQPTIVTAKGDLITAVANANPARLGVGSDGQLLTADSTTATGLSYQNNFAAGKNKIINGDFFVNQRAFSSTTTTGTFGFDRWYLQTSTGTATYSAQTFTLGAAPVAGYEGTNFARLVTSGQTASSGFAGLLNKIEGVRTYAGQTVTLSFWAKASSGTPKVQPTLQQSFGVSGSAGVEVAGTAVTISTSWARYSATMAVPSISGKTIGVNNTLIAQLYTSLGTDYPTYGNIGVQAATIDIWGVQLEAGSTATAFQTATGTIQGELAACQRYLPVFTSFEAYGYTYATNAQVINVPFLVQPRVAPTGITLVGTFIMYNSLNSGTTITPTFNGAGNQSAGVLGTGTGTAGTPARLQPQSNSAILFTGCEL